MKKIPTITLAVIALAGVAFFLYTILRKKKPAPAQSGTNTVPFSGFPAGKKVATETPIGPTKLPTPTPTPKPAVQAVPGLPVQGKVASTAQPGAQAVMKKVLSV